MNNPTVTRHEIGFGESVRWEPPAGTAEFYVWAKRSADNAAMRWKRVAGWDVANGREIAVPEATGNIVLTGPELVMDWAGALVAFDGFDTEILQVTAHDSDRRLLTRDIYSMPRPTSIDAGSIAAQERRFLKTLLDQRTQVAEVGGMAEIADPSGTSVKYADLAALDRRVAEVRARIAWFEAAAGGDVMPRQEHW